MNLWCWSDFDLYKSWLFHSVAYFWWNLVFQIEEISLTIRIHLVSIVKEFDSINHDCKSIPWNSSHHVSDSIIWIRTNGVVESVWCTRCWSRACSIQISTSTPSIFTNDNYNHWILSTETRSRGHGSMVQVCSGKEAKNVHGGIKTRGVRRGSWQST